MKRICTALILILVCHDVVLSQSDGSRGEVFTALAFPVHDFADARQDDFPFFGLGIGIHVPLSESVPLSLVTSFRYYWMGSESRTFEEITSFGDPYEVTYKLKSGMLPVNLHVRLDPVGFVDFPVLPYAGVYGGFRTYWSGERTEWDYLDGTDPEVDKGFLPAHLGFRLNAGVELGLRFRVSPGTWIDIRAERAFGMRSSYVDMSTAYVMDDGNIDYQLLSSRTDMMVYLLGVFLDLD